MRFNSLSAWLAWQETCHPKEIDLGLGRIRRVAERLDLLRPTATVITVAGTNGKGSCVATLEKLVLGRGRNVGTYTSPHVLFYNERIRINGQPATDADICRAFEAIDEARGEISLSYFEFGTLAAFWLFRFYELDYWVLEVGLGGRLDATNILDADVAVVTSIAIDHEKFLGNDRESIGREKAGIFRAGKPVVCADKDAPRSVLNYASELACPVFAAGQVFDWQELEGQHRWVLALDVNGETQQLELPLPQLPLPSVAAALQVAALLGLLPEPEAIQQLCREVSLQGRFQKLSCGGKTVIVDVAHNPAAAELLARRLRSQQLTEVGMLVAMMADKDIPACLRPLIPCVKHWWVAGLPDMPRAAEPEVLQQALLELGVPAARITLNSAVGDSFRQVVENDLPERGCEQLVVTGSFYTVSAVLHHCQ